MPLMLAYARSFYDFVLIHLTKNQIEKHHFLVQNIISMMEMRYLCFENGRFFPRESQLLTAFEKWFLLELAEIKSV